ncbi:hypothetical protein MPTK1_4g04200 [Marchantia polymorpha subsp. ruderalis]|uniref:XS domain-containing protein n=4 Tax=Marchantia polymorpha TaxID=3197 RepID=A0AAF6B672_MARPO|nr:hypothetical protein MARPO_0044s0053 [Marchantia polymorpha]BBN07506.1 hypothetical protein Mp_4g04200 [Marchantia polymorpha subsp. ruderalis]|eukprot:PTQ39591.1 hypothetical protein MARPO_0044s0053 [Marchantia polymorpha]
MLASATGIRADRREMEADEKSAMKQLVVSALAYYGLKVYHVFDGLRFRPSFQLIEIDQRKAVEEFGAAVQADENGVLDEFAREFCWTDRVAIPESSGTERQPEFVPEPILTQLPQEMALQGHWISRNAWPQFWHVFSTFTKDDLGHYVAPRHEQGVGPRVEEAEANFGLHHEGRVKREHTPIEDEETCLRNLEQYMASNCPPANDGASRIYQPTSDFTPVPYQTDGRHDPIHKLSSEDNGTYSCKRARVQLNGGELEKIERIHGPVKNVEHYSGPAHENDGIPTKEVSQPPCVPKVDEIFLKEEMPMVRPVDVAPLSWREELAISRPDLYSEFLENLNSKTFSERENNLPVDCGLGSVHSHPLVDVEMEDVQEESHHITAYGAVHEQSFFVKNIERQRKRARGTDDKASGRTIMNDSSSGSIEQGKFRLKRSIRSTMLNGKDTSAVNRKPDSSEPEILNCSGVHQDERAVSDVGSCPSLNKAANNGDECQSPRKPNVASWPAPLYANNSEHRSEHKTRVNSTIPNSVKEEDEGNCEHQVTGDAYDICLTCRRKKEISFSKYARLFKDDPAWKKKFLDGENLVCDICYSKGKNTKFSSMPLLLSHALKETDFRPPEHRGYAKAIDDLIEANQPGNLRPCYSFVSTTSPTKCKIVWPPVCVLENTFQAGDHCIDIRNLEKVITKRLKGFVNINKHKVHKIFAKGVFRGQVLVEFPPTKRGWIDANRLHQHFVSAGRSLQDWGRIGVTSEDLQNSTPGVQETIGLVKIGSKGEILSRIFFGYLATARIMQRIDRYRRCVRWRLDEVIVDVDKDESSG